MLQGVFFFKEGRKAGHLCNALTLTVCFDVRKVHTGPDHVQKYLAAFYMKVLDLLDINLPKCPVSESILAYYYYFDSFFY